MIALKKAVVFKKILIFILILSFAAAIFGLVFKVLPEIRSYLALKKIEEKINANPAWLDLYKRAQDGSEDLKGKTVTSEEEYIGIAFRWKSLADATGEEVFYLKALDLYDQAIARTDFGPYISSFNAGNVSRIIGRLGDADRYYLKAIELDPGEAGTYMARAELLRYDLRADPKTIKEFYLFGLKRLMGQEYIRFASDYAAYLKEAGDYEEALKQYQLLFTVMPSYEPYRQSIAEIEAKLKERASGQSR